MPEFQPFVMERMMSKFEKAVDYNLSESGVHPLTLRELFQNDTPALSNLLSLEMDYAHANGIPELRENIAAMYPGAGPDNVLVTVGAIEANYDVLWSIVKAGDEVVVMLPNYMQIWGLAKNLGLALKTFTLDERNGWAPDLEGLRKAVSKKTKLIAVCNPNNPTGYILRPEEMDAIVDVARGAGAWILADEVYAGAERLIDAQTPTFYGKYEKVLAVGSVSKAYGLPGLRIGWAVGPAEVIEELWARHEYLTLSATMLSNHLAAYALSPAVRPRLIQRARGFIRRGYPVLEQWMSEHEGILSTVPPQAAAIAFVKYRLDIPSIRFVERLREEKKVLIVPGEHFGLDGFVRISYGLPHEYLKPALGRIHDLIMELGPK